MSNVQHVTDPPDSQRNFLVVDSKTETSAIERAFQNFTQERKDIGVLLINQHVCLTLASIGDITQWQIQNPLEELTK